MQKVSAIQHVEHAAFRPTNKSKMKNLKCLDYFPLRACDLFHQTIVNSIGAVYLGTRAFTFKFGDE
jgi:hypothetical protein